MISQAETIAQAILTRAEFAEYADIADSVAAAEIQDDVTARLSEARGGLAGYKIAWNNPILMERFAMPHPGFGKVMRDTVHPSGTQLAHADFREFLVEPEIVAEISQDIAPNGARWTAESVAAHVSRFIPAFELLDRRGGTNATHAPSILAANVFNAGAVLGGPGVAADFDFNTCETRVTQNGEEILSGSGTCPQHPLDALAFIANHFTSRGVTLTPGQFVLCGSHTPLLLVSGLTEMVMAVADVGEVRFSIG